MLGRHTVLRFVTVCAAVLAVRGLRLHDEYQNKIAMEDMEKAIEEEEHAFLEQNQEAVLRDRRQLSDARTRKSENLVEEEKRCCNLEAESDKIHEEFEELERNVKEAQVILDKKDQKVDQAQRELPKLVISMINSNDCYRKAFIRTARGNAKFMELLKAGAFQDCLISTLTSTL